MGVRGLAATLLTLAMILTPAAWADPVTDPTPAPTPGTTTAPTPAAVVPAPSTPTPEVPTPSTGSSSPSVPAPTEPVVTPPDIPPAEEIPTTPPTHDNLPIATHDDHVQRSFLETFLLKPHLTARVDSVATGQNIPVAHCARVRHSRRATPAGGGPSHASSRVSC